MKSMNLQSHRIGVLHIDPEWSWRGGQQQAAYLFEYMRKAKFHTALVCQPDSKFHEACLKRELPCIPLRIRGELDWMAGFRIARLCRQTGFSILHLHSAHALATGLWANFFFRSLKLVAVRRVDFHIQKNPFSYYKYRTRSLNRLVCISDAIRNILIEDGIPYNRLTTIHSGVDIHRFDAIESDIQFKKNLGIPASHIVAGTVAALVNHKDYPTLIAAAKTVLSKNPSVTFIAVSDGPERDAIRNFAEISCPGNRFMFLGHREDIGNVLKNLDIFILASRQEGMGTSILDAQSVGLPIIATLAGGIPEIVADGMNGLLVRPGDPEALAEAVLRLAADKPLREKLGENGKAAVRKFDVRITIHQYISLYQKLMDGSPEI